MGNTTRRASTRIIEQTSKSSLPQQQQQVVSKQVFQSASSPPTFILNEDTTRRSTRRYGIKRNNEEDENVIYVSEDDYEMMEKLKRDPEGARRELEQLSEKYKRERDQMMTNDEHSQFEEQQNSSTSPEQQLLRQFTSQLKNDDTQQQEQPISMRRTYSSETRERVKQQQQQQDQEIFEKDEDQLTEKDDNFIANIMKLADNIQTRYTTDNVGDLQSSEQLLGRPRARVIDDAPKKGRIHLETQLEKNEKTGGPILQQRAGLSSSDRLNRRGEPEQDFPSTFSARQLKVYFDIKREKEFKGRETSEDLAQFAEQRQIDPQIVQNVAKYVNSVYIVRATKTQAFGFWHKPKLNDPMWRSSEQNNDVKQSP